MSHSILQLSEVMKARAEDLDFATSPLEAALLYAGMGWSVLPLHSILNGKCTCENSECKSPGKHPIYDLAPNGVKNASIDSGVVEEWFFRYPHANVGIATGSRSGLVVFDLDIRENKNGLESLSKLLCERSLTLPSTLVVQTGSGGYHLYYLIPPGMKVSNKSKLEGVDVRGNEGYVVAPPSIHSTGNHYSWEFYNAK